MTLLKDALKDEAIGTTLTKIGEIEVDNAGLHFDSDEPSAIIEQRDGAVEIRIHVPVETPADPE